MKPLIGISAHRTLIGQALKAPHHVASSAFVKSVRKAGGIPVILPLVAPDDAAALLERVDGFILTGGVDIDPSLYGAERDPMTVDVDTERDFDDIALCRLAVERDMPTLAICRGIQVLNVALGGTLVQHLDDHMDIAKYNEYAHEVKIDPDSTLARWLSTTELGTNTLHHQAVDEVGDGLEIAARAQDGTIEAIEATGSRHIVGVQWHPEHLRHQAEHLALFEKLVEACTT